MLKIVAVFLGKSLAAKGISAPAILPSRSDSSSNASRSPYLNGTATSVPAPGRPRSTSLGNQGIE